MVSLADELLECIWGGNGFWLHLLGVSSVNLVSRSVGRGVMAHGILALELVL